MTEMEMRARENHRNGNNCSASLAMAFAEKLGIDKTKEYEQMFLEKNGSLFCKELIARRAGTGRTCNEIVGEAAAMLDSLL